MNYRTYCIPCNGCGHLTSKSYARTHNGLCKSCSTGGPITPRDISKHPLLCPDCQAHLLSPYQKAHNYHCDFCTREADPEGYRREVMGLNYQEDIGQADY